MASPNSQRIDINPATGTARTGGALYARYFRGLGRFSQETPHPGCLQSPARWITPLELCRTRPGTHPHER